MDNQIIADKIELQELANKLFMYVDAQQWNKILNEVFTEEVWFDMKSAGGDEPKLIAAKDISPCGSKASQNWMAFITREGIT